MIIYIIHHNHSLLGQNVDRVVLLNHLLIMCVFILVSVISGVVQVQTHS